MPKPIQPGDKLTVSTRKMDAMALGWLNSQRNRSEAVMGLIRAAALQALGSNAQAPTIQVTVRHTASQTRENMGSTRTPEEDSFSGLGAFLGGLEALGQTDV